MEGSSSTQSMSELRVVLLGNSWSQSSSVGNFILGETKFNTEEEPDCCQRQRGQLKEKEIVLINTPDLLFPSILQHRLRRPVENCVRLSDPGPHVFLLVLQPEDFTEKLKLRLCRVLKLFSDRSFDHSLVLISTPREESPGFMDKYMNHPPLKDMIRKCHYRFLWRKNLERPELLTRLGQIVRENDEQHLSLPREPDVPHMMYSSISSISSISSSGYSSISSSGRSSYNDEEFLLSSKRRVKPLTRSSSFQRLPPNKRRVKPVTLSSSFEWLPPNMSEVLRPRRRSLSLPPRGSGLRQSIVQVEEPDVEPVKLSSRFGFLPSSMYKLMSRLISEFLRLRRTWAASKHR